MDIVTGDMFSKFLFYYNYYILLRVDQEIAVGQTHTHARLVPDVARFQWARAFDCDRAIEREYDKRFEHE